MRLNHVTVAVTDIRRAVDFYRHLGLKQIVAADHYARLECPAGDSRFSIERADPVPPSAATVHSECEDLDSRVAALQADGIEFVHGPHNPH